MKSLLAICLITSGMVLGQDSARKGLRERMRPSDTGTKVSESQATDITLTVSQAVVRPIQTWIRMAGTIDKAEKTLTAYLNRPEGDLVKAGQRVRAFTPDSKSSMYQARITRVVPQTGRVLVEVTLTGPGRPGRTAYVMEIVVDRGEYLSVPNEAIIEEGDRRIVYVQNQPGEYKPHVIEIGVQGELYTQIQKGLSPGDAVVTFGSFFIDAEYKLKMTSESPMADDSHPRDSQPNTSQPKK